jgi:hypothetical protein
VVLRRRSIILEDIRPEIPPCCTLDEIKKERCACDEQDQNQRKVYQSWGVRDMYLLIRCTNPRRGKEGERTFPWTIYRVSAGTGDSLPGATRLSVL